MTDGKEKDIICLHSEAFYALINEVVGRIKAEQKVKEEKWIDDVEAMRLLRITSKSTLQKFRDEGAIRFSQPRRKIILYDRQSIFEYLEQNAQDTF